MFDPGLLQSSLIWMDAVTPAQRFLGAVTVCLAACCFLGALAALHLHRLAGIPVRIHVAGTRGKSATVRLLAAGLGAGGHRVVAKVTGTRPRIILPDGTERPVRRWAAAAIREQRALVATAHRAGANALVAEAMAIEPEYLDALQRHYIRATDLVVTNVRPDHQEQLGPAPDAMAHAIAETIPVGGRLFLTAEAAVPILLERAAARKCEVSIVPSDGSDPEDANRQLALAICRNHGIAANDASAAMAAAAQDIGTFSISPLHIAGRTIGFANAFSCNDVESFARLWRHHQPTHAGTAFLFNPRTDRPVRSVEFFRLLARLAPAAPLFIAGGDWMLHRRAIAAGLSADRVHRVRGNAEQMLRHVAAEVPEATVIWGCGNLYGKGLEISEAAKTFRAPC